MTLIYIDTNIFLNVINSEINPYGKDIAAPAGKLLYDTLSCKYTLLVSTWTLNDLYNQINPEQLTMTFELCKKEIIIVEHNDSDIQVAKVKSAEHWQDALHIVLAEKSKADFIVTRNISDFIKIGTAISIKKPENLP